MRGEGGGTLEGGGGEGRVRRGWRGGEKRDGVDSLCKLYQDGEKKEIMAFLS